MRLNKDHLDKFFDYHLSMELRTIYIGAVNNHSLTDQYSIAEISPYTAENVLKGLILLENKPDEPIKIILNSPGGDLHQALAIYDAIKRSPCHIEILATGECMSAASVILQAADKRVMSKHCLVMIHDGEDSITGAPENVLRWARNSQIYNNFMYQIYSEVSQKPVSYWKAKCKADYILTADKALAEGLVDEII